MRLFTHQLETDGIASLFYFSIINVHMVFYFIKKLGNCRVNPVDFFI
nr:MAG TPA: hypothetical protein [Bacteriophage sp.]